MGEKGSRTEPLPLDFAAMHGIFILSLDTEIAWGTDPELRPRYAACFEAYPDLLRRLLNLLDQYDIAATWAVVGQLMLPADNKRAANMEPAHWFHAPYVVEWIRNAKTAHEISTHTFSHIYTADPPSAPRCGRRRWNSAPCCIKNWGCRCVRLSTRATRLSMWRRWRNMASQLTGRRRQPPAERRGMAHLLDRALALPPPTYAPTSLKVNGKVVNLPASQFLMAYDGVRGYIPSASRVRQARLGLKQAVKRGEIYHLWFHPFNLGTSPRMFEALEHILRDVAQRREREAASGDDHGAGGRVGAGGKY
ncbi:MAG: polysaccharide deacetylase family protein [Anaerolineae bacterium]